MPKKTHSGLFPQSWFIPAEDNSNVSAMGVEAVYPEKYVMKGYLEKQRS